MHLLSAPAIWSAHSNLRTSLQVLTTFHAAGAQILQRDARSFSHQQGAYPVQKELPREEWVRAIVKGADDRSERWKHILVLGGLLTGFEAYERRGLSEKLRRDLERAVVTAANQALNDAEADSEVAPNTICLVLGHCFDLLSGLEKDKLDKEKLLPLLIRMTYFSKEGLHSGYFLGTMDADVLQGNNDKFNWSGKSSTFYHVRWMATGPTVSALGTLSRIAAFYVERVRDTGLLFKVAEDMAIFSRSICIQWRQNKLSELDVTEEDMFLSEEAISTTLPLLWQVLKSTMFSTVIIQGALMSRILGDGSVPASRGKLSQSLSPISKTKEHSASRRNSNPPRPPQPLLHLLPPRSQFLFPIRLRLHRLHRYPLRIPCSSRSIPPRNPPHRLRPHPRPSSRTMSRPLLPQHSRTLHPQPSTRLKRNPPPRRSSTLPRNRQQSATPRGFRSSPQRHPSRLLRSAKPCRYKQAPPRLRRHPLPSNLHPLLIPS